MASNQVPVVPHVDNLEIQPANEKAEAHHEEHLEEKIIEPEQLKSRFDELPITKTLWIFRRSAFYVFLVYMGYLCEGFEVRTHPRLDRRSRAMLRDFSCKPEVSSLPTRGSSPSSGMGMRRRLPL